MTADHAHEMTRHQRALIETSFEEGQYESGIATFQQLRSGARCYPSPPHIRQLLYLALYTPPPNDDRLTSEPASPSKIASRQHKLAHVPTPAASMAAQKLLVSLSLSTPPEVLFRGLPSYQTPSSETPLDVDDGDSFVAKQARCIAQAKDCWAMLKEGFIHENTRVSVSSKWRSRQALDDDDADERESPVAESAWFALEWLVSVFQKDELRNRHSTLLLSQIPPPRGSAGPRWETNAVLDIVFYGLESTNERRQNICMQLFIMLVNLWSTRLIDMQMFVDSVQKRISTSQDDYLLTILRHLSANPCTTVFRIAICHRYLSDTSSEPKAHRRPKPLARVQPRAVRSAQSQMSMDPRDSSSGQLTTPPHPLVPSFDSTSALLKDESSATPGGTSLTLTNVKFHLLMSFGSFQSGLKPPDRDPAWLHSLASGEAMILINSLFDWSRDPSVTALLQVSKAHLLKWAHA